MASPASRRWLGGSLITVTTLALPVLITIFGACDKVTGTGIDDDADDSDVVDPDGRPSNGSFGVGGADGSGLGGEGQGANNNQGGNGQGGNNGQGGFMVTTGEPCSPNLPCDDEGPCVQEDCNGGMCLARDITDDNNVCTMDSCMDDTPVNELIPNNDMNGCTIDVCHPQDGPDHPEEINFYFESFEDGSDWTRGQQWEIGEAEDGEGAVNAANDPASGASDDDNPTMDNRIAGTRLGGGGLIGPQATESFLTSPQITIPNLPTTGGITLAYFRNLTIQAPAQATARVLLRCANDEQEIFASTRFINDETTTGFIEWRHDVRAFLQGCLDAGVTFFQVRFGFTRTDLSANSTGGWNIDNVRLYRSAVVADGNPCTTDNCMNNNGAAQAIHQDVADFGGPLGCDSVNGVCFDDGDGNCPLNPAN